MRNVVLQMHFRPKHLNISVGEDHRHLQTDILGLKLSAMSAYTLCSSSTSLDQSKSQDRLQTDGSNCPTVKIEVGNFTSMNPIEVHSKKPFVRDNR